MTWTDLTGYPYDPDRTMPVRAEPKWNDLFRDNMTYLYNRIARPVTFLDRTLRSNADPYIVAYESFGNDIIVTCHARGIPLATSIQLDTRDPVQIGGPAGIGTDDIFTHIFFNVDAGNHAFSFRGFVGAVVWRSLEIRELI